MKTYIGLIALCLSLIVAAGCSHVDEHHGTTTTTLAPAPSFLGIDLGDSTTDVVNVLGQPEDIYTDSDLGTTEYDYDSQLRSALFKLSTLKVIGVISANENDTLKGVSIGDSKAQVHATLGAYDEVKTGQYATIWVYNSQQVFVGFPVHQDNCMGLGIFDIDDLDILLNIFD